MYYQNNYITKEIPKWIINWVNKVFTLLNTTNEVYNIWLDWTIYIDFVLSEWKNIILSDAPKYSIYVDYWITQNITPVYNNNITLWDIINEVWYLLWQTPNSTSFSRDRIITNINITLDEIWKWRVINILNPQQIIRSWLLYFTCNSLDIRVCWDSYLSEIAKIWDTEIKAETINLPDYWYIIIGWDIINYKSKTNDSLQWVTWLTTNHFIWEKIIPLYLLPNDFLIIDKVEKINNWYKNTEIKIKNDYEKSIYYNVLHSWVNALLYIKWLQNNDLITINYQKRTPILFNNNELCFLPDNYWLQVLAPIVAWKLWYFTWMPQSQALLNMWYLWLRTMYQFYNNNKIIVSQKLLPKRR